MCKWVVALTMHDMTLCYLLLALSLRLDVAPVGLKMELNADSSNDATDEQF